MLSEEESQDKSQMVENKVVGESSRIQVLLIAIVGSVFSARDHISPHYQFEERRQKRLLALEETQK